jgi:hypothetical protein
MTCQDNAGNALTAVTTQTDDQKPATTYLTWDDFVPDPADPTIWTVRQVDSARLGSDRCLFLTGARPFASPPRRIPPGP